MKRDKTYFVINPYLTVTYVGEDEVLLKHGSRVGASHVISDEQRNKLLGRVLRHFQQNKGSSVNALVGVFGTERKKLLEEAVAYLLDENIIVEREENHVSMYWRLFSQESREEMTVQDLPRVGLVGGGYLGARIARGMSALGVKPVALLEERAFGEDIRFDANNFPFGYPVKKGRGYGECMKEEIGEDLAVYAYDRENEESSEIFWKSADVIVVAYESFSPSLFHNMNAMSIHLKKPWIMSFMDGSEAVAGPLFIPGEGCCYNEFEIQQEALITSPIKEEYFLKKEADKEDYRSQICATLPSFWDVLGAMVTSELHRFLVTGKSPLIGKTRRFKCVEGVFTSSSIQRMPRCPACTKGKIYRNLFL